MFLLLLLLAAALTASLVEAKYVFAHVVVGNTAAHTVSTWETDIKLASAAGIDAFVLNIAPTDPNTAPQVSNAFAAANANGSSFKLFFSFDYLGGGSPWPATGSNSVSSYLNEYKGNAAYFLYNGQPFASTFEGVPNAGDWAPNGPIRSAVGAVYFVPSWTSLGPSGVTKFANNVQGTFSWDMWPNGAAPPTNATDLAWQQALPSKTYMMGVAPWFFRSASGGTNWVWKGDDLWAARWQLIMDTNPDFVEIVTWNDYGESHYIGPIGADSEIPTGSNTYVNNMPHDGFRALLPYYISQYKQTGNTSITADKMQYWYRLSPVSAGSVGSVIGNNPSQGQSELPPSKLLQDSIFFTALLTGPAEVSVQVGNNGAVSYNGTKGLNHWNQPFNGQTGNVTFKIVRDGGVVKEACGEAITGHTPLSNGQVNFNTWSGGF